MDPAFAQALINAIAGQRDRAQNEAAQCAAQLAVAADKIAKLETELATLRQPAQ